MRKLIGSFVATAVLSAGAIPAAEAFQLSVVPETATVGLGDYFTVDVFASGLTADSAPALAAYDLTFQYDQGPVQLYTIAYDIGLSVTGFPSIVWSTAPAPGLVEIHETSLDDTASLNALQPDSFKLFTLTFQALQLGSSSLGLQLDSASSAEGTALFADSILSSSVDVVPAPVPLPAAAWLLLSGLTGAFAIGRRRRDDLSTPR